MLEHRQAVRQRDGPSEMEELEAHCCRRCFERPVQVHVEWLAFGELRHRLDVGNRRTRRELLPVARRESSAELTEKFVAPCFAGRVEKRLL